MSEYVMLIFFLASVNNHSVTTIEFSSKELCEAALPAVTKSGGLIAAAPDRIQAVCLERNHERVTKKLRDAKRKA